MVRLSDLLVLNDSESVLSSYPCILDQSIAPEQSQYLIPEDLLSGTGNLMMLPSWEVSAL